MYTYSSEIYCILNIDAVMLCKTGIKRLFFFSLLFLFYFLFFFSSKYAFFLLSECGLFILSVIYCMFIASCRLTTRMALMGQLLSHLSMTYSLYLKPDLTHCSRETRKRVLSKQCRPRSDAAECGVWSGSPLFANSLPIFLQEYVNLIAGRT